MIHHHLTTALRTSLTYYLDQANQQALLDHLYNTAHDDATLIKILQELREKAPKIIPHATAGAQALPAAAEGGRIRVHMEHDLENHPDEAITSP